MNSRRLAVGDQAGSQSLPGLLVSCASAVPFGFISQISSLPVRSLTKAMRSLTPQDGLRSLPGCIVMLIWLLPSAFITQISLLVPRSLTKAIFVLSELQVGSKFLTRGPVVVRRTGLAPSVFMT